MLRVTTTVCASGASIEATRSVSSAVRGDCDSGFMNSS